MARFNTELHVISKRKNLSDVHFRLKEQQSGLVVQYRFYEFVDRFHSPCKEGMPA